MTVTLTMPSLGETMEEGTVSSWLVDVGNQFSRGEALIEFETDKTAVEYPGLGTGRLVEVLVQPGDVVKLGAPIAKIDLEGASDWVTEESDVSDELDIPPVEQESEPSPVASDFAPQENLFAATNLEGKSTRATPLARRAAAQAGLDVNLIVGSGRRGRVELVDVHAAQTQGAQGVSLASESWGPASGVPTLLVHGFAGDRTTFEQLGKGLGRAGFNARAIDLPAHGETKLEATGFDELVSAVASQLSPQSPTHLIGHSLGGAVAAKAAKNGGAASLTLIAPAGLGLSIDADFVMGMAEASSPAAIAHLLRRLSARAASFSDEIIAEIHADLARGRLKKLAVSMTPNKKQSVDIVQTIAELAQDIPVRIIFGQQDLILDWQEALAISPHIALNLFENAGHMPHWDYPAEVLEIITKGLRNV